MTTLTPEQARKLAQEVLSEHDAFSTQLTPQQTEFADGEVFYSAHTAESVRLARYILSTTPSEPSATKYGWHCPNCGVVPGVEVTFQEYHETCGAKVTATAEPAMSERERAAIWNEAIERAASIADGPHEYGTSGMEIARLIRDEMQPSKEGTP